MMDKRIMPETFGFDVPPVEIVGCGSRGLDKTAMVKRASAFDDILEDMEPRKDRTYLHVITTGAMEKFGSNRNGDSFPETSHDFRFSHPEDPRRTHMVLDGGLLKYHDRTYMDKAAVYQEHNSRKADPSGEVIAARYNSDMHRGELIIAVDNEKWRDRLQKKASGQDIYLSMGCSVPYDICTVCGRMAKTAKEHCDHVRRMRCQTLDDGTQVSMINDSPHFYDISGVDVPADRIAFVLRKVASLEATDSESLDRVTSEAMLKLGSRPAMLHTRAARLLEKLADLEKKVEGLVEGDEPELKDDEKARNELIVSVSGYPSDMVVDSCSRKGILLSPEMLFRILAGDGEGSDLLAECDDGSCGDCRGIMEDLKDDPMRNEELLDGSFDTRTVPDIGLENILEEFLPEFGMSDDALRGKSIRIVISGRLEPRRQRKEASMGKLATQALRRTYARYLISFADRNGEEACFNAMRKVAGFGRNS